MLPQSFDTKIVQEASVLKMPQKTLIPGIERGKRKEDARKRENTRELEYYKERKKERRAKRERESVSHMIA